MIEEQAEEELVRQSPSSLGKQRGHEEHSKGQSDSWLIHPALRTVAYDAKRRRQPCEDGFVVTSLLTLDSHASIDERSGSSDHGVARS